MLLFYLKYFSASPLPWGYNPRSWVWHSNTCAMLRFQSWAGLFCPSLHAASILHFLQFPTSDLPSHVLPYSTFYVATSSDSYYRFQLRSSLPRLAPQAPTIGCHFFHGLSSIIVIIRMNCNCPFTYWCLSLKCKLFEGFCLWNSTSTTTSTGSSMPGTLLVLNKY